MNVRLFVHPSFVVRRSSFVVRRSSFVVHPSSLIVRLFVGWFVCPSVVRLSACVVDGSDVFRPC